MEKLLWIETDKGAFLLTLPTGVETVVACRVMSPESIGTEAVAGTIRSGTVFSVSLVPQIPQAWRPPASDSIFVKYNDYYHRIPYRQILWVEASGSYCCFKLRDGKERVFSFSLSEVEPQLPGSLFMRIHRSYLVNLECIDSLIGNMVGVDKHRLPVSKQHRDELLSRLNILGNRKE